MTEKASHCEPVGPTCTNPKQKFDAFIVVEKWLNIDCSFKCMAMITQPVYQKRKTNFGTKYFFHVVVYST